MSIPKKSWKDWTTEDWLNATFCDVCGLPMLMIEDESGQSGTYLCVYCTWVEDQQIIQRAEISRLEYELDKAKLSAGGSELIDPDARRMYFETKARILAYEYVHKKQEEGNGR